MEKRVLLAVLAHPDDESFGPGGTLARYAAEGAAVHVAIATDGAAGSVVSEFEGERERLAEVRRQELEEAVDVLGASLHTFGYRDSGYIGDPANEHPDSFINVDRDEATGRVVALMRRVQPQVVVTHDETGGYFHPDHIVTHEVTTAAFFAAGDSRQFPEAGRPRRPDRLYYTAIPDRWVKLFSLMMRLRGKDPTRMGRNEDIDMTRVGRPLRELDARINIARYWDTKKEASARHQSQGGGGFGGLFPEWLEKRLLSTEYFVRAMPPAGDSGWEEDLFAGIKKEAPTR